MAWLMQFSNSKDIQESNAINANQCSFLKKLYFLSNNSDVFFRRLEVWSRKVLVLM